MFNISVSICNRNSLLNYLVYLRYKNNVSKAFHYLHDKWQHTLPKDVLLEEVKKVLDKGDEVSKLADKHKNKGLIIN